MSLKLIKRFGCAIKERFHHVFLAAEQATRGQLTVLPDIMEQCSITVQPYLLELINTVHDTDALKAGNQLLGFFLPVGKSITANSLAKHKKVVHGTHAIKL